jgi:hypothetical protein
MSGERERDKAIARVLAKNAAWLATCHMEVKKLRKGWTGTGEDIRNFLKQKRGVKEPKHHNAWGGMIQSVTSPKRENFEPTGRMLKMKKVSSHARRTFEYRKVR